MKKLMLMLGLTVILLTGCSKDVYIPTQCPFIEPLDVTITTDHKGGLSPKDAYKAITALKYYGKNTRELKVFIKGINEKINN